MNKDINPQQNSENGLITHTDMLEQECERNVLPVSNSCKSTQFTFQDMNENVLNPNQCKTDISSHILNKSVLTSKQCQTDLFSPISDESVQFSSQVMTDAGLFDRL